MIVFLVYDLFCHIFHGMTRTFVKRAKWSGKKRLVPSLLRAAGNKKCTVSVADQHNFHHPLFDLVYRINELFANTACIFSVILMDKIFSFRSIYP